MDHGFTRAKEPWEASDGAVYLFRETAARVDAARLEEFWPVLHDMATMRHFAHAEKLWTTLYTCLPRVVEIVGKRAFKPYMQVV